MIGDPSPEQAPRDDSAPAMKAVQNAGTGQRGKQRENISVECVADGKAPPIG